MSACSKSGTIKSQKAIPVTDVVPLIEISENVDGNIGIRF